MVIATIFFLLDMLLPGEFKCPRIDGNIVIEIQNCQARRPEILASVTALQGSCSQQNDFERAISNELLLPRWRDGPGIPLGDYVPAPVLLRSPCSPDTLYLKCVSTFRNFPGRDIRKRKFQSKWLFAGYLIISEFLSGYIRKFENQFRERKKKTPHKHYEIFSIHVHSQWRESVYAII